MPRFPHSGLKQLANALPQHLINLFRLLLDWNAKILLNNDNNYYYSFSFHSQTLMNVQRVTMDSALRAARTYLAHSHAPAIQDSDCQLTDSPALVSLGYESYTNFCWVLLTSKCQFLVTPNVCHAWFKKFTVQLISRTSINNINTFVMFGYAGYA